jgi:hypothetical protein
VPAYGAKGRITNLRQMMEAMAQQAWPGHAQSASVRFALEDFALVKLRAGRR